MKQCTDHPKEPASGNIINDLHQTFKNLNLGNQAHELLTLISEMMDIDLESLQFKDEPKTWDEAKDSADVIQWEAGYCDALKSLKDMGVYKLIP